MSLKFIDEYRDAKLAQNYAQQIAAITTQPWKIMEACGGQTHAIVKYGIDRLLPSQVTLVHGPGCPVCVTPMSTIDSAIFLASQSEVILCSFGDMLRVPGTSKDLLTAKSEGGDVRTVYSPLDALKIARQNPHKETVFFAVGFETTAPANGMVAYQAKQLKVTNFSMLVSQVLVPPALEAILSTANHEISGFLAPGHACTITGYSDYERISQDYKVPIVVTGFEPGDILQGLLMCLRQLEEKKYEVKNQYTRCVTRAGNAAAQAILNEVFEIGPKVWRGLGELDASGMHLNAKYRSMDAEFRFGLGSEKVEKENKCMSGLILQGIKRPPDCPEFGKACKPEHPVGATMVSSEGTCAAYYRYRIEEIGEERYRDGKRYGVSQLRPSV